MPNGNQITHYLTQIRTYPVNVSISEHIDLKNRDTPGRIELTDPRLAGPLKLESRPLDSFSFNERGCIQASVRLVKHSRNDFDQLTVMVLPVGTVAAIMTCKLDDKPPFGELEALHQDGERSFSLSNEYSGLIFDFISVLEERKLITHADQAPLDIFHVDRRKKREVIDRKEFVATMEWRAWGSGGYISIDRSERTPVKQSNVRPEDPDNERTQDVQDFLPCHSGVVWAPYENCYVWRIHDRCPTQAMSSPESEQHSVARELDHMVVQKAVEPLLYAISLRSVCASGMSNVKTITRAFAGLDDSRIRVGDLRRYIGETRLSILAVKEYEESSDKVSRAIYRRVCEDVQAEQAVGELRRNLVDVADEIQVVQSEKADSRQARLNSFAFLLTALFGISALVDVITFMEKPMQGWPLEVKMLALSGYAIVLGIAFALIKLFPNK